ncbi:MAG TPA: hypothetical protein VFH92_07125, partial [Phenylobacterium sp.]|nr:hypothetical protein [Phenylobacterium sp.]
MSDLEMLAKAAGAVVAAIGAAAPISDWLTGRLNQRLLREDLAQDYAVAQFWNEWLKLQKERGDGAAPAAAAARVEIALAELPTYIDKAAARRRRSPLSSMLLFYFPRRPIAWAPRLVFYPLALLTAAMFVSAAYGLFDLRSADDVSTALITLGMVAALALVATGFRALSQKLEGTC